MSLDAAGMNWLSQHAILPTVVGLVLNLIGAVLLGIAQGRLFRVLNIWLKGLDFTVETLLQPGAPIVKFTGWEKQMARAVPRSRRMSTLGWILIVLGAALQIPAALPK